jgi:iron transport multicopper oxidase
MPLLESNLHAFINPGAPGIPEYGKADINLNLVVKNTGGIYSVNGVVYKPPTVPVLLQILSGAQQATDLLPTGSVYVLDANKVVELTIPAVNIGGPHPIHIHGHSFDVVQSAGNSSFNYVNPVRRDVVSSGVQNQQTVIRWVTDNSGPWFLHCHIDWHLDAGFAVVMAESPSDTQKHLGHIPNAWDELCPTFNSLTPAQIGAENSYQEAQNISTLLFPNT